MHTPSYAQRRAPGEVAEKTKSAVADVEREIQQCTVDIQHCRDRHDHDPYRYGTIRVQRERRKIELEGQLAELKKALHSETGGTDRGPASGQAFMPEGSF